MGIRTHMLRLRHVLQVMHYVPQRLECESPRNIAVSLGGIGERLEEIAAHQPVRIGLTILQSLVFQRPVW